MPIRWYGPANPEDPTYRHFERIVNLTLHAALFAALNSGLWLVQEMRHPLAPPELAQLGLASGFAGARRRCSSTASSPPAMTLSATDLKELELALADRLYVQVASWHLYLGDAGLAQTLAI